MCGKNRGVLALVSEAVENDGSQLMVLHCFIQHFLCGECSYMCEGFS